MPAQIDEILERTTEGEPPQVKVVLDGKRLLEMRRLARVVALSPELRRLAVSLIMATQPGHAQAPESVERLVRYGSSPRRRRRWYWRRRSSPRPAAATRSSATISLRRFTRPCGTACC